MSAKSQPAEAPNPTRQMLDELDVLMERMLALPVNDLEEAAPNLPKPAQRPALSATLTIVEPAMPAPTAPDDEPLAGDAGKILVGRLTPPSYTAPMAEETPAATEPDAMLPPFIHPAGAGALTPFRRRRSPGNRFLQPLLWINRRYDALTHSLGWLGRWLRGAQGRMVLGYLGLTLLGVAIAWGLRDWVGWWW